jgi:hypothetical protein
MKKILALLFFSGSFFISYGQSLKDLFLNMPQQLCPSLSEYNRLEIVDNQKNGKPMQTRNLFKTISEMKALTNQYAHFVISQNSEKEMMLLTKNDSTQIIMIISTILSDSIADSSVSFYTTDWQPIQASDHIDEPTSDDFRKISINPSTLRLTITTSNPLVLQTDGSNKPAKKPEETHQTFVWNLEQNKFILQ